MRIGYDAKQIFYNKGGLGNYGRNTVFYLSRHIKNHEYYLYTPSLRKAINFDLNGNMDNVTIKTPPMVLQGPFKSVWRTRNIVPQLGRDKIEIYHGLGNELPVSIQRKKNIKTIVTIHDLIFLRYPQFYKDLDRWTYKKKFLFSSEIADTIVAVSKQTQQDLIEFYKVSPQKIRVVYQGCDQLYFEKRTQEELQAVREKFNLPENFILSVGTIEERKNLLTVVRTLFHKRIDIPLVAVGQRTEYTEKVREYVKRRKMDNRVILIHNASNYELSCIYRMAGMTIYPSFFEGFGIPVIESLATGIPVITSKGTCLREAGGDAAWYINPGSMEEIGHAIQTLSNDSDKRAEMIEKGYKHVRKFTGENVARNLNRIYNYMK
ncbi:glycosyltransferase family 4 protein [Saccharicrinis sp. FJH2]|uniref:glycosyltransferase family 4 protein n=1 Tax=Saccharicrinis sp. FJH65 TaxID=3344659 RepID=UPI0035F4B767